MRKSNIDKGIFKLIAIRSVEPKSGSVDSKIVDTTVRNIHKALSANHKWLYFSNGFTVSDDMRSVRMSKDALDVDCLYSTEDLNVSLNAIVGKNGAGKSSLIELMIRMLNNVAAISFGEYSKFSAAEHLHFIDYIYADLCFYRGEGIYILSIRNRDIELREFYDITETRPSYWFYKYYRNVLLTKENNDISVPLKPSPENIKALKDCFFYTVVCNYSFYAYNYRDYSYEETNYKRLLEVNEGNEATGESKYWISGLFHKNDGYQAPIVLNPWRHNGNLDVAKENELAMERLISLMFYRDSLTNLYPFRSINGKLTIKGLYIHEKSYKPFSRHMLSQTLFSPLTNISFEENKESIYSLIDAYWISKIEINENCPSEYESDLRDYIVYKTLKISLNYSKYHKLINLLTSSDLENDINQDIYDILDLMYEDRTHVTSKLRRALNEIKYGYYHCSVKNEPLMVKDIDEWMANKIEEYNSTDPEHKLKVDDILPPPIFDYNLVIEDGNGKMIPFSGLSTGERQVSYTISNMMYHLVNINNSVWNQVDIEDEVKYEYVNLVFDEVELYFHPEMQRNFIGHLLEAIRSVSLPNIRGLNITLVSHSPFVVSDLHHVNILYLGDKIKDENTFGANIYDLLDNSFFMKDSMGAVASNLIKELVDTYYENDEAKRADSYLKKREQFLIVNNILGEKSLKKYISRYIDEMESQYKNNRYDCR